VTSGEEDATRGLARANDVRHGGGGEDAVLADNEMFDPVAGGELDDRLDALGRVEPAITTDDERGALSSWGGDTRQDRLNKVLGVVCLLEDGDPVGRTA
jgi:hypothetical protein